MRCALLIAILGTFVTVSRAQEGRVGTAHGGGENVGDAHSPGGGLRIFLMTFSPGSIIYERFGHNVIVVHDPDPSIERMQQRAALEARHGPFPHVRPFLPTDRAHHYGAFDFEQKGFVPRFVMGRMEYWTTSDWADLTALAYAQEDRAILLQELNLTPPQKIALKDFLETNELPENRYYRYDYYRDNCSTRVRDAIDRATGGELARQLKAINTESTYRSHTRRLTWGLDPLDVWWFTAFTYVMGHPVDKPLSAWEECFLPDKLAEHVRHVRVPDGAGATTPLVISEQMLATTTRKPMPAEAPKRIPGYLIAGLLFGGAFAGLGWLASSPSSPSPGTPGEGWGEGFARGRRKDPHPGPLPEYRERGQKVVRILARIAFITLIIPWALMWGAGGLVAANAWAVTDHTASYRNENLLQFSPLILPLAVLGPMLVLGRRRGARFTLVLTFAIAGLSLLGLLLKIFPAFWQHNAEILALAVPANLGMAAGIWFLVRPMQVPVKRDA